MMKVRPVAAIAKSSSDTPQMTVISAAADESWATKKGRRGKAPAYLFDFGSTNDVENGAW